MDKQKLIARLVERHGIKLDPDDPAFLIVDLNMLMLESHTAQFQQFTEQIERKIKTLEHQAKQPRAPVSSAVPSAILSLSAGTLVAFVLGFVIALVMSREWWVGLVLVVPAAALVGIAILWLLRDRNPTPALVHEKPVARTRTQEQSQASALEQFQAACLAARPQVQGRNRDACRDVLLNGMTVEAAAARHKLFVDAVQECVERLKNS